MDRRPPIDEDFLIDLESGTGVICTVEERIPNPQSDENIPRNDFISTTLFHQLNVDPLTVKVVIDSKVESDLSGKKSGKEKRKKSSSSSAKKPPRPPRGFSLDAADHKLIKELAELAMMKRARIERMKALKQKKALKASSPSSMSGSLFAMIFTIMFFLMIFLQGMSCQKPGVTSQGSPQTAQTKENGLVFIQEQLNPSASDSILPHSKSSNLFEKISGSGSSVTMDMTRQNSS